MPHWGYPRTRPGASRALQQLHFPLDLAGHEGLGIAYEHIDLRAHAEMRQVDAGFNRETGPRDHAPLIVVFQVVHVGAVAMHFHADRMTGAMHEIFAVPGARNHAAAGVVHFEAAQFPLRRDRLLHAFYGSIARAGYHAETLAHLLRRLAAAEAGPGDVVVDRLRLVELGPHIEQHPVARANRRGDFVGRLIVLIGRVGVHAYDRAVVGHQPRFGEALANEVQIGRAHV